MLKKYFGNTSVSDNISLNTKDFIFPSQMGGGKNNLMEKTGLSKQQSNHKPEHKPIYNDFVTLDSQHGGNPAPYSDESSFSNTESNTISSITTNHMDVSRNNWSETSSNDISSYSKLPDNLGKLECGTTDSQVDHHSSSFTSSLQSVSESTIPLTKTSVISESFPSGYSQTGGFFRSGSPAPYAFCDSLIDSNVSAEVDSHLSHTSETHNLEHSYRHMPYSFSESETDHTTLSSI